MNLFQNIKSTVFGTDYIALHHVNGVFTIEPVEWVGNKPSVTADGGRIENARVHLPESGEFEVKHSRYSDPEYPFGYKSWEPITPKIKAYYKPVAKTETTDSTSKSLVNKQSSNMFL